jgi:hypothetical protein
MAGAAGKAIAIALVALAPSLGAANTAGAAGPLEAAGVLLVQTGWTTAINDISTAQLKEEYCAGNVETTQLAASMANDAFRCTPAVRSVRPNDFHPRSKDRLILLDLAEATPLMKTLTLERVSFFRSPARYALASARAAPAERLTHLIMTGTTAITRNTGKSADQHGAAVLTEKVRPYFQTADYIHVSNEVSFTSPCEFQAGLRFCSREGHFQAFKDIRVNVVELTGNHNRDFGEGPFLATLAWFHKNGMRTFGGASDEAKANAPLYLDLRGGGAIGIIGFNELCPLGECAAGKKAGANRFEMAKARRTIAEMRSAKPDAFIIATTQFGETNSYRPTRSQSAISLALIDAGADLVFGSQAHQVQQMEFHRGKIILHGLGNFLFDQMHAVGLRQGYFMNLYFARGRLLAMEPVFTWIDEKRRPAIATEAQAAEIRKAIYSDELLYK